MPDVEFTQFIGATGVVLLFVWIAIKWFQAGRTPTPGRVSPARPTRHIAVVREQIDDENYVLDIGSLVSAPVWGFYAAGRAIAPGTRVLVTWREERQLWQIAGPRVGGENLAGDGRPSDYPRRGRGSS